jgi:hypothetical protein
MDSSYGEYIDRFYSHDDTYTDEDYDLINAYEYPEDDEDCDEECYDPAGEI